MTAIPIRNVYYLLVYAWGHAQRKDLVDIGAQPETDLAELLANALVHEIAGLLSRGLHRDYVTVPEVISGFRGKLDLSDTIKRNLLPIGRTSCHLDDLRQDVARNRILKATLKRLRRLSTLDSKLRAHVGRLYRRFDAVADVAITSRDFASIQGHRHVRTYDFALRLCRLILDSVILDQDSGTARFHDFREDEARMGALFEDFVREFYRVEQSRFKVDRPHIAWYQAEGTDRDLRHLPRMKTDVVLSEAGRAIVMDTKFYREVMTKGPHGTERLRSGHLYQLFAYLENRSAAIPEVEQDGMLLYPVVTDPFAFTYRLKGRRVAIRSVDLGQPWAHVKRDLLGLIA